MQLLEPVMDAVKFMRITARYKPLLTIYFPIHIMGCHIKKGGHRELNLSAI